MNHAVWWYLRFFLAVNVFCLSGTAVWTQNRVFDHYGPKEGLVTSQVLSISKDKNGYLWLGTENGLARYDAHDFRYYRHNYKDKQTLSSNYISDIQCDNHDRIWVSTGRNLDIFDIATGKVQRYEDNVFKANAPKITHLFYDRQGDTMWVTTSVGIFYHAGKTMTLRKKIFPGVTGTIHDMLKWDRDRYVFAGDKAVFVVNTRTGKTKTYHHAYHQKKYDDGFLCVYAENDSVLWAGSWVHGLLQINEKTGKTKTFTYKDPLKSQNGILDIQKLRPGDKEIFLATTDGILLFHTGTQRFQSFSSENIYDPNGIAGTGFTFLADDSSLWVGTYKGLHKYDLLKNFIKNIPLNVPVPSGSPQPQDVCFERDTSGIDRNVWVSFSYESIHRYDLVKHAEIPMPSSLSPFLEGKKTGPYSMLIDRDNILWVSTENHPLLICDLKKNMRITPAAITDFTGPVIDFYEDDKGQVWLATRETWYVASKEGNTITLTEKKEIIQALQKVKPAIDPVPYIFSFDARENIWFLGFDKTKNVRIPVVYDMTRRQVYVFETEKHPELSRLGWIDGLLALADNDVLITGFSGFGRVRKNKDAYLFIPYESKLKTNPDHTKHAAEDRHGNIIMSTDFGISYLNKENDLLSAFTYYTTSIGNAIQPGIFLSPNSQKIYLGQKLSLDYFDPGHVFFPAPGAILLASVTIRNYAHDKKTESGDMIDLRHDQNQIQLSVTNLFYTNPEYSKYFYRWDDKEPWTENPDNLFNFSNLSPGKYTLQIKSSNAFGIMGKDIFTLTFVISPPFYKAWWFYLLLSLSGMAAVYTFFWYRDQQRKKMEKLRHHIARDLHDDLGSSLSYIRILSESEARKTTNNLSFRNISEKTAEIMNNMSEIIWSINPVYDSFNNVVTRLQDFAIDTLEPLDIELKFEIETLPAKYKLSPENRRQYYLIFKEAINNAAKYAKAKKVVLTIRHEKKHIITRLEDDGIGFDSLLIHKGNGLKNMKSRADLLGGTLVIETNDRGTRVELTMKG